MKLSVALLTLFLLPTPAIAGHGHRQIHYESHCYKNIEKYIPGREIQAAILGNRKLGIIELKPKRKFYDYKAKYSSNAKTEHIIPVKLPDKKFSEFVSVIVVVS